MSMSNYLENKVLNHITGQATYTSPSVLYVGLFTTDPADDGSGIEVSGSAYSRQVCDFTTSTTGSIHNLSDIVYPVATGSWGTVTHAGVYDAISGGNLLFYSPVNSPAIVGADVQVVLKAGELVINLD